MNHTRGPLTVSFGDGKATIKANDGHGPVATIRLRRTLTNNTAELAGNARLFTASPEAYEIIAAIHEFFRHHNPCDPSMLMPSDDRTLKQAVAAYMTAVDGVER